MITQEELKKIVNYDIDTDEFTWKIETINRKAKVGDTATVKDHRGYSTVVIKGIKYPHHRLASLYILGEYPRGTL